MSQYISNWIKLTSSDVHIELIVAQSLAGVHAQLSLDSGVRDPEAWGEPVVIVPVAHASLLVAEVGGADEV